MKVMKWQKSGLIFTSGKFDWMKTHAQNPLPEDLGNGDYRVHFAGRDSENRARGAYFTFNIKEPSKILEVSSEPSLDLGELGAFDDAGVMPSSLIEYNGKKYMYYTGWSRTIDVPFAFHIGLAVSTDGKPYERLSKAPVLGRNYFDPFIVGGPYVIKENGLFRMWYSSATKWIKESPSQKAQHYYTVKHATSNDGINWNCSSQLCLDYENEEYAIARPVVFKEQDTYYMWFTYRGGNNTYRVGIATSLDGISWRRLHNNLGIDVSDSGWDSEMICYAHPIVFEGQTYALYNGNSYGLSGIGLAKMSAF